jgi:hypothetical protein
MPSKEVKEFLSKIGSIGGKKSHRVLTRAQALEMVRIRLARKQEKQKKCQQN